MVDIPNVLSSRYGAGGSLMAYYAGSSLLDSSSLDHKSSSWSVLFSNTFFTFTLLLGIYKDALVVLGQYTFAIKVKDSQIAS
jgi:hypothetical protein